MRKLRGNSRPCFSIADLIDSKFLKTEAYIDGKCKGSYKKKKKPKQKLLQGLKYEKTKNCNKTTKASNCRKTGVAGGTVRWRQEQCSQEK